MLHAYSARVRDDFLPAPPSVVFLLPATRRWLAMSVQLAAQFRHSFIASSAGTSAFFSSSDQCPRGVKLYTHGAETYKGQHDLLYALHTAVAILSSVSATATVEALVLNYLDYHRSSLEQWTVTYLIHLPVWVVGAASHQPKDRHRLFDWNVLEKGSDIIEHPLAMGLAVYLRETSMHGMARIIRTILASIGHNQVQEDLLATPANTLLRPLVQALALEILLEISLPADLAGAPLHMGLQGHLRDSLLILILRLGLLLDLFPRLAMVLNTEEDPAVPLGIFRPLLMTTVLDLIRLRLLRPHIHLKARRSALNITVLVGQPLPWRQRVVVSSFCQVRFSGGVPMSWPCLEVWS
ncbi:hypothetical protein OE88DRAFT_1089181 [Heliocybe sulcata]|uniref:Uncharacterized protein n=1 Tax=Heliocybe sulcata TaxID=5364 RepID=A0A5C3MK81_9AGAM|nr:hypothetical protein OE88DRAFT_1089181 [Heliocybe sulcata]